MKKDKYEIKLPIKPKPHPKSQVQFSQLQPVSVSSAQLPGQSQWPSFTKVLEMMQPPLRQLNCSEHSRPLVMPKSQESAQLQLVQSQFACGHKIPPVPMDQHQFPHFHPFPHSETQQSISHLLADLPMIYHDCPLPFYHDNCGCWFSEPSSSAQLFGQSHRPSLIFHPSRKQP